MMEKSERRISEEEFSKTMQLYQKLLEQEQGGMCKFQSELETNPLLNKYLGFEKCGRANCREMKFWMNKRSDKVCKYDCEAEHRDSATHPPNFLALIGNKASEGIGRRLAEAHRVIAQYEDKIASSRQIMQDHKNEKIEAIYYLVLLAEKILLKIKEEVESSEKTSSEAFDKFEAFLSGLKATQKKLKDSWSKVSVFPLKEPEIDTDGKSMKDFQSLIDTEKGLRNHEKQVQSLESRLAEVKTWEDHFSNQVFESPFEEFKVRLMSDLIKERSIDIDGKQIDTFVPRKDLVDRIKNLEDCQQDKECELAKTLYQFDLLAEEKDLLEEEKELRLNAQLQLKNMYQKSEAEKGELEDKYQKVVSQVADLGEQLEGSKVRPSYVESFRGRSWPDQAAN